MLRTALKVLRIPNFHFCNVRLSLSCIIRYKSEHMVYQYHKNLGYSIYSSKQCISRKEMLFPHLKDIDKIPQGWPEASA